MILHIPSDGSGESALAQAVAQHRAAFFAGVEVETEPEELEPPEAGSACSEFLEDARDTRSSMQMLAGTMLGSGALILFSALMFALY